MISMVDLVQRQLWGKEFYFIVANCYQLFHVALLSRSLPYYHCWLYLHRCWFDLPFFPTCQVRVARFYQSCSSSSLFSFSSTPSLSPILFADPLRQVSRQSPSPAHRSEHRWTSTGDLPSSVSTAGPQPPDGMPACMPDKNAR